MKKTLKPASSEEAIFYSDFSGKLLKEFVPAKVVIQFGYTSVYDGTTLELHLDDQDCTKLLEFLQQNVSEDCKKQFQRELAGEQKQYQQAADSRDWPACDIIANNEALLKKIIFSEKTN